MQDAGQYFIDPLTNLRIRDEMSGDAVEGVKAREESSEAEGTPPNVARTNEDLECDLRDILKGKVIILIASHSLTCLNYLHRDL